MGDASARTVSWIAGVVAVLSLIALLPASSGASPSAAGTASSCAAHWVGSWIANPSDASSSQPLSDQTLRMIIAPHLAGSILRVRLSNRFGSAPVTLGPVSIGIDGSGPALTPGSLHPVTFGGAPSVTIPAGADVTSDPVSLSFGAFQDLAISVDVPGSITAPTEHSITRQTSYLTPAGSGNHAGDTAGGAFTQTTTTNTSNGWYFLDGIDVRAPATTGAVVAFGDSITDGFQGNISPLTEQLATINTNGRYPDDLDRRLIAAHIPLSVLNAGISGNRVLQDGEIPSFGPSGLSRFGTDALRQPGVTDVIVLEGINDIGQTVGITAQDLIAGYEQLIKDAHAAGIRIQLGTLTPSGGTVVPAYGDAAANQLRDQVNQWIRTQHLADGVIDFDAAVRDPQDPSQINPAYDGGDHLHFNLAGYQALANAVDLSQLKTATCASAPAPRFSCAKPSGRLTDRGLGPVTLGMTRARARSRFARFSLRGRRYMDFFCPDREGIRVGYPSPKLLRSVAPARRRGLNGRVVLALTANPHYALRGVHPGTKLAAVARRLRPGRGFHIGLNWWYLVADGSGRGVLKVRHGRIGEVGIANRRLTDSRRAARTFLSSFS